MQILSLSGLKIDGVYSCLPPVSEDNLKRCEEVYGDVKKAMSVVKATGIRHRRVVDAGVSSLDLCVGAAESLIQDFAKTRGKTVDEVRASVGGVVDVTFTPERTMPCNACQAQERLALPKGIAAFDINLACSGYAYGLSIAGMLAKATGKRILLLDGDVQTSHVDSTDVATVPVMADAGTATLLEPSAEECEGEWKFAFFTDGGKGDLLTLPFGGRISMDGLGIFRFVTMDVLRFIQEFMTQIGLSASDVEAFVPHQANVFMIQQIAKKLGIDQSRLWLSGDVFGNSSSATVPTTIAHCAPQKLLECKHGRVLISGFGGGLSASVGLIDLTPDCLVNVLDYKGV